MKKIPETIGRRKFLAYGISLGSLLSMNNSFGSFGNFSQVDIVIVGSGLAGLTCGCLALELGASSVVILEKEPIIGGTSATTNGFWTVGGTKLQKEFGIEDSDEEFFNDMLRIGNFENNKTLVHLFVEANHRQFDWVLSQGITPKAIVSAEGKQRAHLFDINELMEMHRRYFVEHGGIIQTSSKVVDFIFKDSTVKGIVYTHKSKKKYLESRLGVLLATGGFSRNKRLIKKYAPTLLKAEVVAAEGATGDGLEMAVKLGAQIIDTENIKASFGFLRNPASMDDLSLIQYSGAVIVNQKGKRFVNESLPYKQLADHALRQNGRETFVIFDENIRLQAMKQPPDNLIWNQIEKRILEKRVFRSDTLFTAAENAGLNGLEVQQTIRKYNNNILSNKEDEFKRLGLPGANQLRPLVLIQKKPFYVFPTTPAIIGTYCGIVIDKCGRVLNPQAKPIHGLWAAGEILGGIHGASFIMGTALAKAAAFGRVAAFSMVRGNYLV